MAFVQYNHGVEIFVGEGKLRAGCDTWHGGVTKPTVVLDQSIRAIQVKVLRKQREMRFGVVDFLGYIEAMEKEGTPGASWCRTVFRGGTAIFLCCYAHGAILFSGNKELAVYNDFTLREGDTISVVIGSGTLSFKVEGQPEIKHHGVLAEQLLGVQFHTTGDEVSLNTLPYAHGVEVGSGELKAVCQTVHGQPEKPTAVFPGPMAVRIERKTAEMRFGVVDLPRYMAAVDKGTSGQSWYSAACTRGVAIFLCCYKTHSLLFNGRDQVASLKELRVVEGNIVALAKDGGYVCFLVDGKEVARTPAASSSGLFALQLHATGDCVRLLSGDPPGPSGLTVGPPSSPPGKSIRHGLPALRDAALPQHLQELLPPDGFLLRPVGREEESWKAITKMFTVTRPGELHVGKDVPKDGFPAYDAIRVAAAWQILGWKNVEYVSARDVLSCKLKRRRDLVPSKLETGLDGHCSPFLLNASVTEKLLLHGTRPESVVPILANGLNEKFCDGIFGAGTYLAEDVEKIDQYVRLDAGFQADGTLKELHNRVYGDPSRHPGNCFYGFVCRASLGCVALTRDGDTHMDPSIGGSLWAVPHRELAAVPGSVPEEHFHALVVEKGGVLARHREFVVFHSTRVLPEFLVAFHRTQGGVVVP